MRVHRDIFEPLTKHKLDKNRLRVKYCPCGKSNKDGKFVPYVGYENKGYCHSCGETFLPEHQKGIQSNETPTKLRIPPKAIIPQPKHVSFVPIEVFKASLSNYTENNFVKYLIGFLGSEIASHLVGQYFIGTSNHWHDSTIFWQIDTQGNIRTGKIMLYDPVTGRRVKEPFSHITWVHACLKQPDFELKQCFFGEHLLRDQTKPVAIVESEKTAIISSIYLPRFIWLASGNKEGLKNIEKCKVLKGRTVILFPDLKAYKDWADRAKELSSIANVSVSDLLERKATEAEREQGLDLADFLIRFDHKSFSNRKQPPDPETAIRKSDPVQRTISAFSTPSDPVSNEFIEGDVQGNFSHREPSPMIDELSFYLIRDVGQSPSAASHANNWDIAALEEFFNSTVMPTESIILDVCTTIVDIRSFIDSNLATVKANNGNPTYLPYFEQLTHLKAILAGNHPTERPN